MINIDKTGNKEYVVTLPASWNTDDDYWIDLITEISGCICEEGTIYINLTHINRLSAYAFNRLFDLSSVVASKICRLVFINIDDELEEKIAMLSHNAE